MDNDIIKKILEVAVYAPSGSNSQPWKFNVSGNEISLLALPEKDHPILNYRNRGTWIAHGALIENIIIAASHYGYRCNVGPLFPDATNPNLVTRISLEQESISPDPLYASITARASNRKPYKTSPIIGEQKAFLLTEARKGGEEYLIYIEDRVKIQNLAHSVSANEIVMLENRRLHDLFFDELVWTAEEEKKKLAGLYVKTMELAPSKENALKLFKHWGLMRIAILLGIPKKIAQENAVTYASCAGAIVIATDDRDEKFIHAGRMMQRLWLSATKLGLSGHLITGIFFLHQRMVTGDTGIFFPPHIELINTAYTEAATIAVVPKGKIIALMLRIGDGGEPSAHSSRKAPIIDYTII